jgi:hypothetical protein
MANWTAEELDWIGNAEEIQIAPRRRDGSFRRPVVIWLVRHGDRLFVRSVNGADAAWFRATRPTHEAHISASGVEKDVRLVETGDDLDDAIDAAYESKYRGHTSAVRSITSQAARATSTELVPQPTDAQ